MKKLFTIALLSAGLALAISSCKSDNEKYWEMTSKASDSPITELETPEGFRFDMTENDWTKSINQLKSYEIDFTTYIDWLIGDKYYAGYINKREFGEGKLCYYEIWIRGRKVNNSIESLTSDDISYIVNSYKAKLKGGFEHALHQEDYLPFDTHLWTKENLMVEVLCPKELRNPVIIKCSNQPMAIKLNKNEEPSTYTPSTITPKVEVKNNKWNGGVKQVEDYLERTLRDPDSYESIEWSEVKQKDDGYYVRHKYRAKNGFGGSVVTNQLFHLDFSGNVVEVKDLY